MNKNLKSYLCIWAILVIAFNVIAFVACSNFTPTFWIGYIFIMISLIAQLLCTLKVMQTKTKEHMFYNLSLISISYTSLIVSFIVGAICMLVPAIPYYVAVIVCVIILAFYGISIFKAEIAIDNAIQVNDNIKTNTLFIKTMIAESKNLYTQNQTNECKQVYEAFRYSDPMSNSQVTVIEEQIQDIFLQFKNSILTNKTEEQKTLVAQLLSLIDERNTKVRLMK